MPNKTTTAQLLIKQLQFVEESVEGTTPSSSPTFSEVGKVSSLSFNIDNNETEVLQIGPEDIYGLVQGKTRYGFKIKTAMFSSTFLKYCMNSASYGAPAGTISAPLSFVFSFYLNGTENFVFLRGSRCTNMTITGDISQPVVLSAEFVCMSISEPSTTSGLTTPNWITPSIAVVWDWLSGGASPVSWNAVAINAVKIEITVNRNTAEDYTLGNAGPYTIQAHGRRIAFTVTQLWTDTVMSGDRNTATARSMTWTLKSGTSTITLTSAVLDKQQQDISADQASSLVQVFNGKAQAIAVT